MAATPPPPRLTPHQREVLDRLARLYLRDRRPVLAADLGCAAAVNHLRAKGYAQVERTEYGPRGGARLYWAPTELGQRHFEGRPAFWRR